MGKFDNIMFETHENIKKIMQLTINDCSSPDDEFLTAKSIDDVVLIATSREFMVADKDKFKNLQISSTNGFLI